MVQLVKSALAAAALALAIVGPAWADVVSAMVDVSQYNDLDAVIGAAKTSNLELVVHRATLGTTRNDVNFGGALKKIRTAKLMGGAYHVLYGQTGPEDLAHAGTIQAHYFLEAVAGACKAGDPVLLALDWETPSNGGGVALAPASAQTAAEFVSEVRSQTGAEVVIYTDARTLGTTRAGIGQVLSGSPLWFAAYHRLIRFDSDPRTVTYAADDDSIDISIRRRRVDGLTFPIAADFAPWTAPTFWQFSEGGDDGKGPAWPGVKAFEPAIPAVDTDYFFGTRESLRKFVARTAWKCDPKIVRRWTPVATVLAPPAPPPPSPDTAPPAPPG